MNFNKDSLANGVRVLTEKHSHSIGVSIGVWINLGSRDEPEDFFGACHLIEHLVFKGTLHYSAFEIAKSLEELGGELNAFTTREYVCFHAYVLKEHWRIALNILYELTTLMQITNKDFDLEKSVILQEIGMAEDQPEELIYDRFLENVYFGHGLGHSIAGSSKSVLEMKKKEILQFYKNTFVGERIVISACGDLSHQDFQKECNIKFGSLNNKTTVKASSQKKNLIKRAPPEWNKTSLLIEKSIDQSHILIGLPSPSFQSQFRFEALVMNALLGGGMTSRLYQTIREKKGLVYSIYSQLITHSDAGCSLIYASCESDNLAQVAGLMIKELEKLSRKNASPQELEHFKTQVIGQIRLNSDDLENRMNSLAINELNFEEYKSVDWVVEQVQKVNLESIEAWRKSFVDLNELSGVLVTSNPKRNRKWWSQLF